MVSLGHVKTRFVTVASIALALALGSLATAPSRADDTPSAAQVLRLVRFTEGSQNRSLTGRLRMSTDEGNIIVPFRLKMDGSTITYSFDNPPEALVLHLGDKSSRLDRVTGRGKTEKISGAKLDAPVRGTDITYEDLALKFLYWNNAVVEGEENVGIRRCWVVRAVPSSSSESQYDMVRLWVDKSGGLLQADCFSHGKKVKRFKVTNVQRSHDEGGGYILKSLRVERMDMDKPPTYLEINPPK